MELRHLRYFKTVADEGHITRAAEKLGMQQPPLSLQIKSLEQELGVRLFKRLPRGVELTEAGKSYYDDVLVILDNVQQAQLKAQRISRGEQGSLAVGFTSSVIFHPKTKSAIQKFREQKNNINLTLVEDGSKELVQDVANNRLDVAFIRTNLDHIDHVRIDKLIDEEIVVALPSHHELSKKISLEMSDIHKLPLILYRRSAGPGIYDRVISALDQHGVNPNIVQEAPRVSAALNLVATGMGVSFVPSSLASSHSEDIEYRSLNLNSSLTASIYLASRKNDTSVAVSKFVQSSRKLFNLFTHEN